ncbi:hypothetical protein BH23BAC1_BH23BAC1_35520 [soil metagenome]
MNFFATGKITLINLFALLIGQVFGQQLNIFEMEKFNNDNIKSRLYDDVDKLTSIRPFRNYQNLESLNQAADFIFEEFKKNQANPSFQEYEVRGNTYKNVIVHLDLLKVPE